jgi:hypothetical protein
MVRALIYIYICELYVCLLNNLVFCRNVPLQACIHKLPVGPSVRGSKWPETWPQRLEKTPFWIDGSHVGVYGKPGNEDFEADYAHWKRVVGKSYVNGMGIDWSKVRNVMDMRAVYGG